jgi:hypothetical protein
MDDVQKVCHFNNTPSSQTFRICLSCIFKLHNMFQIRLQISLTSILEILFMLFEGRASSADRKAGYLMLTDLLPLLRQYT